MEYLSDEILAEIFSFLPFQDVYTSIQYVNVAFNRVVWYLISRHLQLSGEFWVTSDCLRQILRKKPSSLRKLTLSDCYWFNMEELRLIKSCSNLVSLKLDGHVSMTGKSLIHILTGTKLLKDLSFSATSQLIKQIVILCETDLKEKKLGISLTQLCIVFVLPDVLEINWNHPSIFIGDFIFGNLLDLNHSKPLRNLRLLFDICKCDQVDDDECIEETLGVQLQLLAGKAHSVSMHGCRRLVELIGADPLVSHLLPCGMMECLASVEVSQFEHLTFVHVEGSDEYIYTLFVESHSHLPFPFLEHLGLMISCMEDIDPLYLSTVMRQLVVPKLTSLCFMMRQDNAENVVIPVQTDLVPHLQDFFFQLRSVNLMGVFLDPYELSNLFKPTSSIEGLGYSLTFEGPSGEASAMEDTILSVSLSCILSLRYNLTELDLCGEEVHHGTLAAAEEQHRSDCLRHGRSFIKTGDQLLALAEFVNMRKLTIASFPYQRSFKFLIEIGKNCKKLRCLRLVDLGNPSLAQFVPPLKIILPTLPELQDVSIWHDSFMMTSSFVDSLAQCKALCRFSLVSLHGTIESSVFPAIQRCILKCENLVYFGMYLKQHPQPATTQMNPFLKNILKKRPAFRLQVGKYGDEHKIISYPHAREISFLSVTVALPFGG